MHLACISQYSQVLQGRMHGNAVEQVEAELSQAQPKLRFRLKLMDFNNREYKDSK